MDQTQSGEINKLERNPLFACTQQVKAANANKGNNIKIWEAVYFAF